MTKTEESVVKLFEDQDMLLSNLQSLLYQEDKEVCDFNSVEEIIEYIDDMEEWLLDASVVEDILWTLNQK